LPGKAGNIISERINYQGIFVNLDARLASQINPVRPLRSNVTHQVDIYY
jgi:hypothetical protein